MDQVSSDIALVVVAVADRHATVGELSLQSLGFQAFAMLANMGARFELDYIPMRDSLTRKSSYPQRSSMLRNQYAYWLFACLTLVIVCVPVQGVAGEPFELERGVVPQNPQQPQVAVDNQGAIHVVYGIGGIVRYRRSDDGGKSFSNAVDLPSAQEMSLGMRRGPRIAVTENSICVTVIGGKQGKGRDGNLLAMRSTDEGKTWTTPVAVNDAVDSAREGLHAMCAGPSGELCCIWLDLRRSKTEVMASVSKDGGGSWSRNVLVYQSPTGNVCECCHPSVAIDGLGRIHAQWRNSLRGNRDIYQASSTDGGMTFGEASKMGLGSWLLNACPMDGGAIAVGGDNTLTSVWRRDKMVFLTVEGKHQEQLLGEGEQPWVASTESGPFVVWLKKRGGVAYLLMPESPSPIELAKHASDPVIATNPHGRSPVVAAWETRDGQNYSVYCQVVANE